MRESLLPRPSMFQRLISILIVSALLSTQASAFQYYTAVKWNSSSGGGDNGFFGGIPEIGLDSSRTALTLLFFGVLILARAPARKPA